ncbi:hypothetical protein P3T35_000910 [Kitasatospora sp. GP30]|uniref:hypothetical protein n=1 Tax=Kitasatospora sp. GP30 TaxID=3035084 RepID=UPI000C7096EA|nr:hypothetical protein [Kitasatospora sp. GP30]MDH6138921.1 hypothetical protein [Kitasatospora sp. GP30]
MTHPIAWAFAWAICLLAAWALAWAISAVPDRPVELEPIRVQLGVRQPGSWQPPASGSWEVLTAIPPHVVERAKPLAGEDNALVRGRYGRLVEDREALRLAPVQPCAAPGQVVPLWVAFGEAQQQAVRRRALEVVAAGWPDPGYTYPGAQCMPGAVA